LTTEKREKRYQIQAFKISFKIFWYSSASGFVTRSLPGDKEGVSSGRQIGKGSAHLAPSKRLARDLVSKIQVPKDSILPQSSFQICYTHQESQSDVKKREREVKTYK